MIVEDLQPFGLEGSAGSTPLRITVKGDPPSYLFAKLYARSHLRADRSYKLGRALLYGRLEDEKPFNTVRRFVQQEDYALALMPRAGLAHRDVKPANLLVRDGQLYLIDVFFTEVRPSPWRQGVDWPTCCWCSLCGASPGASMSERSAGSPSRRSVRRSRPPAASPCRRSCAG